MPQLRNHEPKGDNAGDNTTAPVREAARSSAATAIKTARSGYWMRAILFLCVSFLVCMAALKWTDVVEWVGGEWRLKPKREAERDKQMRKIDDAEQYALVADISGYYECLHCPTKRIFLKSNEVWKYGVTNQGEKQRYTTQFLEQRVLRYLVQLRGTYSQCLVAEKRKLFEYPILPENLARPDSLKIVLPPGNLQTR
jgi:hypothetical protein